MTSAVAATRLECESICCLLPNEDCHLSPDFAEDMCKGLCHLICEFNSKASIFILKQTSFILADLTCTSSHDSWIFTSYVHLYSHPSHFPPTPIPKSQSKETFRASSIDIQASAADWQGKAIQQDKAIRCHDTGKPLIIDFSIKTT